jgi:large subunit ribosomal protein L13
MSTNALSAKNIKRAWYEIDAEGKILGRLSGQVAILLMGKHKTNYVTYLDNGDYVVVKNAAKIKVTGKKMAQKVYTRHSGYPGGLKQEVLSDKIIKSPEKVLEHAIKGMLPKNKLGREMFKKLKVFAGDEHPFKERIQKNG